MVPYIAVGGTFALGVLYYILRRGKNANKDPQPHQLHQNRFSNQIDIGQRFPSHQSMRMQDVKYEVAGRLRRQQSVSLSIMRGQSMGNMNSRSMGVLNSRSMGVMNSRSIGVMNSRSMGIMSPLHQQQQAPMPDYEPEADNSISIQMDIPNYDAYGQNMLTYVYDGNAANVNAAEQDQQAVAEEQMQRQVQQQMFQNQQEKFRNDAAYANFLDKKDDNEVPAPATNQNALAKIHDTPARAPVADVVSRLPPVAVQDVKPKSIEGRVTMPAVKPIDIKQAPVSSPDTTIDESMYDDRSHMQRKAVEYLVNNSPDKYIDYLLKQENLSCIQYRGNRNDSESESIADKKLQEIMKTTGKGAAAAGKDAAKDANYPQKFTEKKKVKKVASTLDEGNQTLKRELSHDSVKVKVQPTPKGKQPPSNKAAIPAKTKDNSIDAFKQKLKDKFKDRAKIQEPNIKEPEKVGDNSIDVFKKKIMDKYKDRPKVQDIKPTAKELPKPVSPEPTKPAVLEKTKALSRRSTKRKEPKVEPIVESSIDKFKQKILNKFKDKSKPDEPCKEKANPMEANKVEANKVESTKVEAKKIETKIDNKLGMKVSSGINKKVDRIINMKEDIISPKVDYIVNKNENLVMNKKFDSVVNRKDDIILSKKVDSIISKKNNPFLAKKVDSIISKKDKFTLNKKFDSINIKKENIFENKKPINFISKKEDSIIMKKSDSNIFKKDMFAILKKDNIPMKKIETKLSRSQEMSIEKLKKKLLTSFGEQTKHIDTDLSTNYAESIKKKMIDQYIDTVSVNNTRKAKPDRDPTPEKASYDTQLDELMMMYQNRAIKSQDKEMLIAQLNDKMMQDKQKMTQMQNLIDSQNKYETTNKYSALNPSNDQYKFGNQYNSTKTAFNELVKEYEDNTPSSIFNKNPYEKPSTFTDNRTTSNRIETFYNNESNRTPGFYNDKDMLLSLLEKNNPYNEHRSPERNDRDMINRFGTAQNTGNTKRQGGVNPREVDTGPDQLEMLNENMKLIQKMVADQKIMMENQNQKQFNRRDDNADMPNKYSNYQKRF